MKVEGINISISGNIHSSSKKLSVNRRVAAFVRSCPPFCISIAYIFVVPDQDFPVNGIYVMYAGITGQF
jgi:hypothetical protein